MVADPCRLVKASKQPTEWHGGGSGQGIAVWSSLVLDESPWSSTYILCSGGTHFRDESPPGPKGDWQPACEEPGISRSVQRRPHGNLGIGGVRNAVSTGSQRDEAWRWVLGQTVGLAQHASGLEGAHSRRPAVGEQGQWCQCRNKVM